MAHRILTVITAAMLLTPVASYALSLGFEGQLNAVGSDNVGQDLPGDEETGSSGNIQLGVFGEQRGRIVSGGFLGEIISNRDIEDEDAEFNTFTNFLGALNFQFTPSFSWYIGNVIGGVREDNALVPGDDFDLTRRNIFATGPTYLHELSSFSFIQTDILYISQTEEDQQLDQVINGRIRYQRDAGTANSWGLELIDNYIDNTEDDDAPDTNRLSLSAFFERERGRYTYTGAVGSTRYDTDDESVADFSARLGFRQQLGPKTAWSLDLNRDLLDQTLSTIDSFLDQGSGVEPETEGVFQETRLTAAYEFLGTNTTFDIGASVAQSDFEFLNATGADANLEDQLQSSVFAVYQRDFNSRLSNETTLSYEVQEYDNRVDSNNSVLATTTFNYRLTRSLELALGYRFNQADGVETNFDGGTAVLADVDYTENRATIGIIWAPPTRASREPIVALRQLLQ